MADQKTKKVAVKSHPAYKIMVTEAIKALKTTKVSRIMCQKYILANYKFDNQEKATRQIAKTIAKLLKSGYLAQVKGTGANGSFKLSATTKEDAKNKEKAEKKKQKAVTAKAKTAAKPKKTKTTKAKKASTPKKTVKKTTKKPVAKKTTKKTTKKPAKKVTVKKPAAKKSPKKKTAAKKTGAKKAAKK